MSTPIPRYRVALAALLVVLAATLPPAFGPQLEPARPCLLLCGAQGFADWLVNVVLYVPLGAGLALARWPRRRTILAAFLLSAAIESFQWLLPGRDPSAGDVIANTLGAALGYALAAAPDLWLRRAGRAAIRLATGWALLVVAIVAASGVLLQPHYPPGEWYGQWTAKFGHMEWYGGRIQSARVGTLETPSWRHERSDSLRTLLTAGAPVEVRFRAGPPPPGPAPIFSIADHRQRTMIMLAAEGEDLLFTYRSRTANLRLDAPGIRLREWLAYVPAGDTLTLRLWHQRDGFCLTLAGHSQCQLGFSPARGWALFYWLGWAPDWLLNALDVIWMAILFFPFGLWFVGGRGSGTGNRGSGVSAWYSGPRGWMLAVGMALGAVIFLPAAVGLRPSGLVEFLGLAAGLEAGLLVRREVRRLPRAPGA